MCTTLQQTGWSDYLAQMPTDQPHLGSTVLVVEDDVDTRDSLAELIRDALGCDVLHAFNGVEALEIIDSGTCVDLVFSDIMMPAMDGLELTDELRKRGLQVRTALRIEADRPAHDVLG